jgi:DNA-binding response OmpR family regulator
VDATLPRILLVDDEPSLLESLRYTLSRAGYAVATAADGVAALELAEDFVPDLVILDLGLPKLDGVEVCRRLRAEPETSQTTIVMLTAAAGEEAEREAEDAGADLFLTKPFSPLELLRLVHDLGDGGAAA